jgi:hypothetical protein
VSRVALGSLVVVLFASFAGASRAQSTPVREADDPAARAEASRTFDEGVRLLRERDWAGALAAFEASRAIRQTPSVLFNIAGCQRALRRFADARRTYQRFLVIGTRPDQRDEATRAVTELEREVATLTVTTNVEGAELRIDGRPVPAMPLDLDVGREYALEARREGHRSAQQTVRPTAAGPLRVALVLEPSPASPVLAVSPPPDSAAAPEPTAAPVEAVSPPPSAGSEERSGGGSALPWILAGTAVLLAGAAVGGFFLLSGDEVPAGDASFHPR